MGWFLSNKKKKKRKTSRGAVGTGWDPQRTLMGLKIAGGIALAVAMIVGWNATERTLGQYARDARSADISPESVRLVDAPSWIDAALRDQLYQRVVFSVTDNPLDSRGLQDAVSMLNESPWIAEVHQVRRSPHGVVKVFADYRTPAAVVASSQGYYVVDRGGVRLEGPIDRAASRWGGLPLVTGVSAAAPAPGKTWEGADIPAALALENILHREGYADQITAYDVSHRDLMGRLWLVLYTDGPAIIWGLPPGEERAVEPEAPIKLAALRDWAYKHGGRINVQGEADTVWVYTGTAQIDARPSTISASRR